MKCFYANGVAIPEKMDRATQVNVYPPRHINNQNVFLQNPIKKMVTTQEPPKDGTRKRVEAMKNKAISLMAVWLCFMLFNLSTAWAQSAESRTAEGQTEIQPLMVGDIVPEDFWLKESLFFVESDTVRRNLKKYKGRSVVIAFWSLDCGACLLNLPKLELLQKEFGNRLMIIPVNSQTRRNDYERFYDFFNHGHRLLPKKFSLPSIVYDTYYNGTFPYRILPRYIWISPNGVVKAVLSSEFLNSAQIQLVLDKEGQK